MTLRGNRNDGLIWKSLSVKLFGSVHAKITSCDPDRPLSEPIFAVNWFDTRFALIYNLYNLLAARSVYSVGGRPLFKGKTRQCHLR